MPVMKKCTTLNGVNLKPGHFADSFLLCLGHNLKGLIKPGCKRSFELISSDLYILV